MRKNIPFTSPGNTISFAETKFGFFAAQSGYSIAPLVIVHGFTGKYPSAIAAASSAYISLLNTNSPILFVLGFVFQMRFPEPSLASIWSVFPLVVGSLSETLVERFVGACRENVFDASESERLIVVLSTKLFRVVCSSLQFQGLVQVPGILTAAKTIHQTNIVPTINDEKLFRKRVFR